MQGWQPIVAAKTIPAPTKTKLTATKRSTGFVENKGQFRDHHGNPNPDVLYVADFGGLKVLLRKDGFSYETYKVKPKWVDPGNIPNKVLTITDKGDRSREAHLSDFAPTDLANMALFGTEDDDSNPATGRYYKTANNLPWGINLVEKFDYPIEKAPITEAHLKFGPWAESNGALILIGSKTNQDTATMP
jgi:hypothetical protein